MLACTPIYIGVEGGYRGEAAELTSGFSLRAVTIRLAGGHPAPCAPSPSPPTSPGQPPGTGSGTPLPAGSGRRVQRSRSAARGHPGTVPSPARRQRAGLRPPPASPARHWSVTLRTDGRTHGRGTPPPPHDQKSQATRRVQHLSQRDPRLPHRAGGAAAPGLDGAPRKEGRREWEFRGTPAWGWAGSWSCAGGRGGGDPWDGALGLLRGWSGPRSGGLLGQRAGLVGLRRASSLRGRQAKALTSPGSVGGGRESC